METKKENLLTITNKINHFRLDFSDGGLISYNAHTSELIIECPGKICINGKEISFQERDRKSFI